MKTDLLKRRSFGLQSGVLRDQFPIGEVRETKLNEICPTARERFPFFFKLPYDDPIKLLKWRIYVRKRCVKDAEFRSVIWEMCRRDVAFFAVTFAVIFEPRPLPRWLPFNLWTDQVSLLSWFTELFGRRSGAVDKTRGIGLSWLTALFIFHAWLFHPECKIAVLTKDKDLLDGPDCNSSLGKIQYLFDHLPAWAKFTPGEMPLLNRLTEKHTLMNAANGAMIHGFVSTSTKLRQLRFTMIFADEFAFYDRTDQDEWITSASGCTNCLLLVSTWNDFDDMFHHIVNESKSSLLVMRAFWENNPERWKGAYRIADGGRIELIDKDYRHTPQYKFGEPGIVEQGLIRSPWVDAELLQPGKDRSPLKALRDIYGMKVCLATNSFFDREIQQAAASCVKPPDKQGVLDVSTGNVVVIETLKSDIRLWGDVANKDRGPYVGFADLGQGVEGSYSVFHVLDRGGEQVLEFGTNVMDLTTFANRCVLLARWLGGENGDSWVLIDYEANGPFAKPFKTEVLRMDYGNLHYSQYSANTKRTKEQAEENDSYGGTRNNDGGLRNFREFGRALMSMEVRPKSELIAADMKTVSKDENGLPKLPKNNLSGHGDFLQAAAGAWWRAKSRTSIENRVQLEEEGNIGRRHAPPAWEQASSRWSDRWNRVA